MRSAHPLFAVCLCVLFNLALTKKGEISTVETDVGTFNGYVRSFKAFGQDFKVRRFFGIPYAEPPVGYLRFVKPVPKAKLETPFDATEHAPSCKQQVIKLGGKRNPGRFANNRVSEDCLYLNIYTPEKAGPTEKLLPVMIYIHGGGFVFGSPKLYAQDILSVYGEVVAVTIAYRLSIWGFLSTGDKELPGNYGLWDQQMAIQWVHDNIAKFGGDPNSVTIYGSSAGGSSVVFQGMYPGNQGLIHRVISQSGTATSRFALNKDPLPGTARLGKLVGCSDETTKLLADCLKSRSSDDLFNEINVEGNNFTYFPWDFIPVVDNDFLPEHPADLFHGSSELSQKYRKSLSDLDLMIGATEAEGFIHYSPLFNVHDPDAFVLSRLKFETELIPLNLNVFYGDDVPYILEKVVAGEYTNWDNPNDDTEASESFVKFVGDIMFTFPVTETAKVHSKALGKSTYVFVYEAFPSQHLFALPAWGSKPNHLDDMTTLLGYDNEDGYVSWTTPYSDDPPEDWELELSKAHIKMWTNFARTGNPNGPDDVKYFTNTVWPAYDTKSEHYMKINREMSGKSVGQRPFARALNFWQNVIPGVIEAVKGDDKRQENQYCERDCKP